MSTEQMNNYNGFVYQWINIKNNKKYIGSHLGHEDDGYVASGKYFKRAYKKNPAIFKRTIIEYVIGGELYIRDREQYYLDLIPNITKNKE